MKFEEWKKECKRLIYEQEKDSEEGLTTHNMSFVDDWDLEYKAGMTPKEALSKANDEAHDQYIDED